ncbi:MAG: signal peptide peptidase SppA [Prevotellaceae bacterium]|jgi:protease-4|nr:signal peptide peptidase SppA [Prevotellaceae bacterium]
MKDFFKMLFAAIIGCSMVLFFGTFFLFSLLGTLMSLGSAEIKTIPQNAILRISFEKPLLEQSSVNPISRAVPFGLYRNDGIGYYDVVSAVDRAAEDSRIQMIYLNTNFLNADISHVEELRNAFKRFRQSGKAVIAYSDSYSQAGYYLASVADKVFLNPNGSVGLRGFAVSTRYYKGLMDELGIEAQVIRHGTHKSGGEQYVQLKMSDPERKQLELFLQSAWNHWAKEISEARQVDIQTINTIAERSGCSNGIEAKEYQLIDESFYLDEVAVYLCKLMDVKSDKQLKICDIQTYIVGKPMIRNREKIAILFANGALYTGKGDDNIMTDNYIKTISQLRTDSTIKAVVLRIDSPGGDAMAASIIHRELKLLTEVKPLIVSMGGQATSGGYWMASAGNQIFGSPATLTGSIGAYAITYSGQKALNKWLKVNVETVRTHPSSDAGSIYRPMNEQELATLQKEIDDIYLQFVAAVSEDRGLSFEEAEAIAQGRIWSGADAITIGMIDQSGGLVDAIDYAAKVVDLSDYQIVEYPSSNTFLERLMQTVSTSSRINKLVKDPQKWAEEVESMISNESQRGVQVKSPFIYSLQF